jgi:hypothetical protein
VIGKKRGQLPLAEGSCIGDVPLLDSETVYCSYRRKTCPAAAPFRRGTFHGPFNPSVLKFLPPQGVASIRVPYLQRSLASTPVRSASARPTARQWLLHGMQRPSDFDATNAVIAWEHRETNISFRFLPAYLSQTPSRAAQTLLIRTGRPSQVY